MNRNFVSGQIVAIEDRTAIILLTHHLLKKKNPTTWTRALLPFRPIEIDKSELMKNLYGN